MSVRLWSVGSLVIAVGLGCVGPAHGQADTGRHRRVSPEAEAATPAPEPARWQFVVQGGVMSSGDLLRVRTDGTSGIPWDPPGGPAFASSEFLLTLDEDVSFGIGLIRVLNDWLALRSDASFGQLAVTAEARIGETVDLFRYEQLKFAVYSLGFEAKLVRNPSYPYALAGAAVTVARGASSGDFDQTRLAARYGFGYHHDLGHRLGLRGEIRSTLQQFKFEDYMPPVQGTVHPNATIQERGPQQLWELQVGLSGRF